MSKITKALAEEALERGRNSPISRATVDDVWNDAVAEARTITDKPVYLLQARRTGRSQSSRYRGLHPVAKSAGLRARHNRRFAMFDQLEFFPFLGRLGEMVGTGEMTVPLIC